MPSGLTFGLLVAATVAIGLLAGASLDQSVKQLPARQKIGVVAYSAYSQAADLGNGIALYAGLGLAAVFLNVAAAVAAYIQGPVAGHTLIYGGAVLAVLHSIVTGLAAPTNFSQRASRSESDLAAVFDRFARLQAIRCALQVANFGVNLWALTIMARQV